MGCRVCESLGSPGAGSLGQGRFPGRRRPRPQSLPRAARCICLCSVIAAHVVAGLSLIAGPRKGLFVVTVVGVWSRLGNSRFAEVLTSPFQTCFPIRRNGTGLRPLVGFRVPEGKARLRLRCLGTPAVKGEREGPRAVATRPADGALRVRAVTSPEFSG